MENITEIMDKVTKAKLLKQKAWQEETMLQTTYVIPLANC